MSAIMGLRRTACNWSLSLTDIILNIARMSMFLTLPLLILPHIQRRILATSEHGIFRRTYILSIKKYWLNRIPSIFLLHNWNLRSHSTLYYSMISLAIRVCQCYNIRIGVYQTCTPYLLLRYTSLQPPDAYVFLYNSNAAITMLSSHHLVQHQEENWFMVSHLLCLSQVIITIQIGTGTMSIHDSVW